MSNEEPLRLDKTAFQKQSVEEANDHQKYYRKLSSKEQSKVFNYLMSSAFGFVGKPWPRMDKTAFSSRKRS